jgi:hypothetical protein
MGWGLGVLTWDGERWIGSAIQQVAQGLKRKQLHLYAANPCIPLLILDRCLRCALPALHPP